MWNYVKIEDEWYFTDVTWNDTALEQPSYLYFNIDITRLYYDHALAENNFSHHDCVSSKAMYYIKNGADLNSDYAACARLVEENNAKNQKYAEFICESATDTEIKSRLARLQLRLKDLQIERYIYYRDIVVVYWQ